MGAQRDTSTRLYGHEILSGVLLKWEGQPPLTSTVGFELNAIRWTEKGLAPVKISRGLLPLEDTFVDTARVSPPFPPDDPLEEMLTAPSAFSANEVPT